MALFYVTGLSGTGKSAVLAELRARGYYARGVDEDGYGDWISRAAGTPDDFPGDAANLDFHAWYREHEWVLSMRRIGVLSRAAARLDEPVFLCGTASGDGTVWHLFDKVLALVADVPTLKRRIAGRAYEFGKAPDELTGITRWHASFEAAYRGFGAAVIDATQPLASVVDQILAASIQAAPCQLTADSAVMLICFYAHHDRHADHADAGGQGQGCRAGREPQGPC